MRLRWAVVKVTGLDHLVLVTVDVERSLAFYAGVLGLLPERVHQWRAGEVGFPSVRVDEGTIIDVVAGERSGTNVDHVCLVLEPTDLDALAASAELDVVRGPVEVFGARGTGRSVYVRDPDGNVVELRCYPA